MKLIEIVTSKYRGRLAREKTVTVSRNPFGRMRVTKQKQTQMRERVRQQSRKSLDYAMNVDTLHSRSNHDHKQKGDRMKVAVSRAILRHGWQA